MTRTMVVQWTLVKVVNLSVIGEVLYLATVRLS